MYKGVALGKPIRPGAMSQDKTVWSLEYRKRGHLAGVGAGIGRITTFTSFSS